MLDRRTEEETLGEIVSRVVDNGKDYVRAEIGVVRATVGAKVAAVRPAAIYIVCAIFLLQAALTVLTAGLGMALAYWLGTAGGLAAGAVVVLLIVGLLGAAAYGQLKKAFA